MHTHLQVYDHKIKTFLTNIYIVKQLKARLRILKQKIAYESQNKTIYLYQRKKNRVVSTTKNEIALSNK